MSDLISRQDAIEAIAKFVPYAICDESTESYTNGLTDAYNLICQLPSAQPEQRWIPCSERLPEDYTVVLVYTSVDGYFTAYFDGICWYHAGLHMMRIYSDVVAWMPLPPAYHADEESNA